MAPVRRFVPRKLCECRKALGECEQALLPAFEDGLPADTTATSAATAAAAGHLFRLLGKPKSGDWLAEHEEIGQSFPQYQRRMNPKNGNAVPRPACSGLLICPVGKSFSDALAQRLMPHLLEYCAAFFPGMAVEVLDKPLSLKGVQSRANGFGHKQFLISDIFTMLNTQKEVISRHRSYCRLGITFEDIYPGEEWNYVFGQARPLERVGVFSFARHSPLFYRGVHATEAVAELDLRGLLTWMRTCRHTMVHETCHMLGILHCVYWNCLMNGNNGPGDQNGANGFLCPVCLKKLLFALSNVAPSSLEVVDGRYAAMQSSLQALADEAGDLVPPSLRRDLAWLRRRRGQLRGEVPVPEEPAGGESAEDAAS